MKRFKRPLVVSVFLLVILYFAFPLMKQNAENWIQRFQSGSENTLSASVSRSIVYVIKPDQWLSFNIEKGTEQIKIISNANIKKPDLLSVENYWKYIIRYQLLDKDGKVILEDLYYQKTKLTSYQDKQKNFFFGNYYSGYDLVPLDGRLIKLSMLSIKQAASIRISLVKQSPEVEEASIRFYVRAKVSEHRLADTWLRMSNSQKETMAKHSVYPASLLSETEKINLLQHQWQPVGPMGVENKDYISKTLYFLKDVEANKFGEQVNAAGLQLDPSYVGIIAIPEQGGEVSIELTGLDGLAIKTPVSLQLNWFGREREKRWHKNTQWLIDSEKLSYTLAGGLLQIKSSEPVLVHAYLKTESLQNQEITPKPLLVTAYLAIHGVDYQVLHVNNRFSTIRVDIRQVFGEKPLPSIATVEYQWFNDDQQLISSGSLSTDLTPSIYDRLGGELNNLKISDPVGFYLDIPLEVSRLRLHSVRDDLIVNAFNQPYRYKKTQRVPENSFVLDNKNDWSPSWFLLRPENEQDLLKKQAVVKVSAQYRPPEENLDLLADQYLWEDYQPVEQTEAQYILTEFPIGSGYRDEALASIYCQLNLNTHNQIRLKAYGNLSWLSPELIYIRPKKNDFNISVFLDRKRILSMPAIGNQGAVKLSKLSRGNHSVRLRTQSGGQWLMNYVSDCSSQAFLKRRVFKLRNRQLTFIYNNDQVADRVFSARFYTLEDNDKRSVIEVNIEPIQQLLSQKVKKKWTFTRRVFDIRAAMGLRSIMLYRHGYFLNSGESFFIPFNSDMPKGQYRIKFTLLQGEPGYLALSQVKPGAYEQRRFYRETSH